MLVNPAHKNDEDAHQPDHKKNGYVFAHRKGRTLQPLHKDLKSASYTPVKPYGTGGLAKGSQQAIELIRSKVAALYADEPDAKEELTETAQSSVPAKQLSKHQRFMHELSTSGKPLAQIQTEWHNYYISLPTEEKHEVWREFYQANSRQPSAYTQFATQQAATPVQSLPDLQNGVNPSDQKIQGAPKSRVLVGEHLPTPNYAAKKARRTAGSKLKKKIVERVNLSAETQAKAKQQIHSLLFGLGTGALVLIIFLFSFFNEMFIAPFIQPSRHASATPIIVTSDSVAASESPEVIIPKIGVQIPVVYDEKSADEAAVQRALERGVIHYPTTVLPGQQGNAAFFGHSSNNIFNKGKYKFAFVLLRELVPGDVFYLTYNKVVYAYRVYDKKVVAPTEVSVLNNVSGKTATATLITCDPPGTSTNRLVVWGEQISPDPSGASAPTTPPTTDPATTPTELPSEGPTLWNRFWNWLF